MPGNYSKLVTVVVGQIITSSERNNEFDNVIDNMTPDGVDDASFSIAAMQAVTDPAGASLATSLRGELQRLRFQLIKLGSASGNWYDVLPFLSGITPTSPALTATDLNNRLQQIAGHLLKLGSAAGNWYDSFPWLAALTPIAPAATAADLNERLAQIVGQLKIGFGLTNWYDTPPAAIQQVPAGLISDFGGTTPPSGWLDCDGTAVSRTTYANLFSAIGETWGAGDGSTTFNLPALQRRTTVGSGGSGTGTLGSAVGNTGGAESVTSTQNPHTHTLGNHTHTTPLHTHVMDSDAPTLVPASSVNGTSINSLDSDGANLQTGFSGSSNSTRRLNIKNRTTAGGAGVSGTPSTNTSDSATPTNNPASVIQPSAVVKKIIKT